jgi:sulfofructose kinase
MSVQAPAMHCGRETGRLFRLQFRYREGLARRVCYDSARMRIPFRIARPDAKPFDVVGFGHNSIDFLTVVAEHPAPNSKQRLQRFARLPGGEIATAIATCAQLGWRTRYIGSFGDDDLGAIARESLTAIGVDISASRIVSGATNQFAVILVDARSGDRTVLWDRHPALTMTAADVAADVVTSGRVLIVDCADTAAAVHAAKLARDAGIPTVIDVEKVRPGIGELLQYIDAIIAAEPFPTSLTGHEDLGRALQTMGREFGAVVVTVTLGAKGSLTWSGGREIRTPAFPVDCVDTTGAGDVFRGGFAAGCLRLAERGGELEDVLAFASAAAAINCRALGARGALPSSDEVDRLLQSTPNRA